MVTPQAIRVGAVALLLVAGPAIPALAQEAPSAEDGGELIDLNRRLFETMILEQSADLLLEVSDESYVVVAPGGVMESRAQAIRGLAAFSTVDSITISRDRVIDQGSTAVILNRLEIHGTVQGPVGRIGPMSAMTVFRRSADDRWTVVSRALTPCNPLAVERGIC